MYLYQNILFLLMRFIQSNNRLGNMHTFFMYCFVMSYAFRTNASIIFLNVKITDYFQCHLIKKHFDHKERKKKERKKYIVWEKPITDSFLLYILLISNNLFHPTYFFINVVYLLKFRLKVIKKFVTRFQNYTITKNRK